MSTIVLVHGAWHGSWCWDKIVPLLESASHTVKAIDLPGHGTDTTPLSAISLERYMDCICQVLEKQSEKVILVGHSLGGIFITLAGERVPEKINTLIYIAAFLPGENESAFDLIKKDKDSKLMSSINFTKDYSSSTIRDESLKDLFYNQCEDRDVIRARTLLVAEASGPIQAKVAITEERFGKIPRIYIECIKDRVITTTLQKQMYTATPCKKIISMDSDHSPFFSHPEELADALITYTSM